MTRNTNEFTQIFSSARCSRTRCALFSSVLLLLLSSEARSSALLHAASDSETVAAFASQSQDAINDATPHIVRDSIDAVPTLPMDLSGESPLTRTRLTEIFKRKNSELLLGTPRQRIASQLPPPDDHSFWQRAEYLQPTRLHIDGPTLIVSQYLPLTDLAFEGLGHVWQWNGVSFDAVTEAATLRMDDPNFPLAIVPVIGAMSVVIGAEDAVLSTEDSVTTEDGVTTEGEQGVWRGGTFTIGNEPPLCPQDQSAYSCGFEFEHTYTAEQPKSLLVPTSQQGVQMSSITSQPGTGKLLYTNAWLEDRDFNWGRIERVRGKGPYAYSTAEIKKYVHQRIVRSQNKSTRCHAKLFGGIELCETTMHPERDITLNVISPRPLPTKENGGVFYQDSTAEGMIHGRLVCRLNTQHAHDGDICRLPEGTQCSGQATALHKWNGSLSTKLDLDNQSNAYVSEFLWAGAQFSAKFQNAGGIFGDHGDALLSSTLASKTTAGAETEKGMEMTAGVNGKKEGTKLSFGVDGSIKVHYLNKVYNSSEFSPADGNARYKTPNVSGDKTIAINDQYFVTSYVHSTSNHLIPPKASGEHQGHTNYVGLVTEARGVCKKADSQGNVEIDKPFKGKSGFMSYNPYSPDAYNIGWKTLDAWLREPWEKQSALSKPVIQGKLNAEGNMVTAETLVRYGEAGVKGGLVSTQRPPIKKKIF